jgi:hypothetical protein
MGRSAEYFTSWSEGFAYSVGDWVTQGAGTLERLQAGYASFFNEFLSEAEQGARQIEAAKQLITQQIGDWALDAFKTRDAFTARLSAPDAFASADRARTTGALISVAGAFDVLFDAAEAAAGTVEELVDVIEGLTTEQQRLLDTFIESIKPAEDGAAAWEWLAETMRKWGAELPSSTDALYEMFVANELTTEQMLELAASSDKVSAAFEYVRTSAEAAAEASRVSAEEARRAAEAQAEAISSLRSSIYDLTTAGADLAGRYQSLMQSVVGSAPQTADDLYTLLGTLGDDKLATLADNLNLITGGLSALERQREEARAAAEQAAADALRAQEEAIAEAQQLAEERRQAAIDAQQDAIRNSMEGIRDVISDMDSAINSLSSAMDRFRASSDVIGLDFERARRQLAAMAASSVIPSAENVASVTDALVSGADSRVFKTAAQERAENGRIFAQLLAVRERTEGAKTYQEELLERMEARLESIDKLRDEMRARDTARNIDLREVAAKLKKIDAIGVPLRDGEPAELLRTG